jgi:hypothetical protein
MDTLFTVALWAAFLFVMMRWGCGAHMQHGHRRRKVEGPYGPTEAR